MSFEASFQNLSSERTTVNPTIANDDPLVDHPGRSEGAASKGAIIRRCRDVLLREPGGPAAPDEPF
ncbi:hypothetical protein RWK44_34730, partial [Rhizobium sp. 25PS6]|uniref:hypothetical protein n=1 Tax=Rhizobium sp. 25PS6 TaxID=3075622 RepID=UPI0028FD6839